MSQINTTGLKAFTATEALEAYRRVKLTTSSGTAVEYADAGEDFIGVTEHGVTEHEAAAGKHVTVRLWNVGGTFKMTAAGDFAVGATLYGAADGKVDQDSNGSVVGKAAAAASGDDSRIEVIPETKKSTTAATVSIADSGGFTGETTVEAALAEIYQHIASANVAIGVPLGSVTQEDGTALLKQATTVAGFAQLSDKEHVILIPVDCTAGEALAFHLSLPRDLDDAADVIIDVLVSKDADNDSLTLDAEAYFVAAGDLANADAQDTAAQAIVAAGTVLSFTCGADGVPAAPCALTVVLTLGGTNDGDAVHIHGIWVRYTRKILTS